MQNKKPKSKPKFNVEKNDSIKWAKYTWNPVWGCKYNCKYCYARDRAIRFYGGNFEPIFHEDRLAAPANSHPKEPHLNRVFVCSMADLFGPWVPDEWIQKVIDATKQNDEWNYLFLTKNPKRYLDFEFPFNCKLGATADTQKRADVAVGALREIKARSDFQQQTFLSCEPLEEMVHIRDSQYNYIDWLIIGGRRRSTGMPAKQPNWYWVESLVLNAFAAGVPLFMKENLEVRSGERLQQIPDGFGSTERRQKQLSLF